MTLVLVSNLRDNLYRDRNLNPTTPAKKAEIKESIDQTGFWDNLMCRFENNQLVDGTYIESAAHLATILESGIDLTQESFELGYGHHRLDVCDELGMLEMDIAIKYLDDETMLRVQSNENKDGWGHGIETKLETVRQVKANLEKQIDDFTTFKDYQEANPNGWFTAALFKSAKTQGVGGRTIQKFLGDSWSSSDVSTPVHAMSCIEKGYFAQSDILGIASIGLLEAFCSLTNAIHEGATLSKYEMVEVKGDDGVVKKKKTLVGTDFPAPQWGVALKKIILDAMIEKCTPDADNGDQKITQKAVTTRKENMLKTGVNPAAGGSTPMNLTKEIIKIEFPEIYQDIPEDDLDKVVEKLMNETLPEFIEKKEYADVEGYEALVESIRKSISRMKDPKPEESDLQKAADESKPSSEYESTVEIEGLELETEGEDGEVMSVPVGQAIAGFIAILNGSQTVVDDLMGRYADIRVEDEAAFIDVLSTSIKKLAQLRAVLSGGDALTADISAVMASLNG